MPWIGSDSKGSVTTEQLNLTLNGFSVSLNQDVAPRSVRKDYSGGFRRKSQLVCVNSPFSLPSKVDRYSGTVKIESNMSIAKSVWKPFKVTIWLIDNGSASILKDVLLVQHDSNRTVTHVRNVWIRQNVAKFADGCFSEAYAGVSAPDVTCATP